MSIHYVCLSIHSFQERDDADDDDDEAIFDLDGAGLDDEQFAEALNKMRADAEKLDGTLVLFFDFIKSVCGASRERTSPCPPSGLHTSPSANSANSANSADQIADAADPLVRALLGAFLSTLLPTYKTRSTQFLLFYLGSFDGAYADAFLELLVAQVSLCKSDVSLMCHYVSLMCHYVKSDAALCKSDVALCKSDVALCESALDDV